MFLEILIFIRREWNVLNSNFYKERTVNCFVVTHGPAIRSKPIGFHYYRVYFGWTVPFCLSRFLNHSTKNQEPRTKNQEPRTTS